MMRDNLLYRLAWLAAILAFFVVTLGAYTRLKDAGLGCPDWPGCYGHMVVPKVNDHADFVGQVVEPAKAWSEMTHRYVAGTLATLILVICCRSWWLKLKRKAAAPVILSSILVLWVMLQASLGRFTVTLKLLPPVVMLHLLAGLVLFSLLVLFVLRTGQFFNSIKAKDQQRFKRWAAVGLVLLFFQVILGGWTSANYASLSCPSFPNCVDTLVPELHLLQAFSLADKLNVNYQGGVLDQATRMTIHFFHRAGAMMVFVYWLGFLLYMLTKAESAILLRFTTLLFFLLVCQLCLGISNVVLMLPLHIAVAHNAGAALLLVTVVALNYALFKRRDPL